MWQLLLRGSPDRADRAIRLPDFDADCSLQRRLLLLEWPRDGAASDDGEDDSGYYEMG